ncbi:Uncharacterised protein [uncultured archaeon]|nr:Uncharacterised protein [uncultured archaeon]
MTTKKRSDEAKKVNVHLVSYGNIEEVIIENNYFDEALKANNAKYIGEIECTECLRNLRAGRANFENTEGIKNEISDMRDYIAKAEAYVGSAGFFRVHGDGLWDYEKVQTDIADAKKYVSEFENLLTEIMLVKQRSYKPINTWINELVL